MTVPRPLPTTIPDEPGAYLFRESGGRVVYVGKATSLRKRLASYWGKQLHPRTQAMVTQATTVEWIVANGEVGLCHSILNRKLKFLKRIRC